MRPQHEDLYRKTVDQFVRHVREERFTPEAIPRIADGLRMELAQCIELGLIGSQFYSERMEILGRVLDTVEA